MTTQLNTNTNTIITKYNQVYDPANNKVAVAMTKIPEEYDQIYYNSDYKQAEDFTDPMLIYTIINYEQLTEREKIKIHIKIQIENYKKFNPTNIDTLKINCKSLLIQYNNILKELGESELEDNEENIQNLITLRTEEEKIFSF